MLEFLIDSPQHSILLSKLRCWRRLIYGDAAKGTRVIRAAISLWFQHSNAPYGRQSRPDESITEDTETLAISSFYQVNPSQLGYLGVMAMLSLSNLWGSPNNPKLRNATLVANTATSFAVAALAILPNVQPFDVKRTEFLGTNFDDLRFFLQSSLQLSSNKPAPLERPISQQIKESKLSKDETTLARDIGMKWARLPHWHPGQAFRGTPWSSFFVNYHTTIYSNKPDRFIWYKIPSTAMALAYHWEDYYFDMISRFDEVSQYHSKGFHGFIR